MALNTTNSLAIAFKKLSGKAHTQQNFAVSEEGISTNVQVSYSTIFANRIEPLPVTNSGLTALYDSNGIVQRVKFQIDIIPDTQIAVGRSQGYRLKLPSDWNGNGDLFPEFSAGTYLHTALGKLQIVPSLYGTLKLDGSTEYDPILYQTNGSTVIAKFDPINWYFDPYNGLIFIQDPPSGYDSSASRPGYLEAFLYVGDYIDDVIFDVSSGSTGTTGQNVGGEVGVFKDKIVTSGGTGVLRFKTFVGLDGVTVTADTDNVFIGFSGASALTSTASNGLTKQGQTIVLGGALTGNTTIDPSGNTLTLSGRNSSTIVIQNNADGDFVGQDYVNSITVEGYGMRFESYSGSTNASTLEINDLGFNFFGRNLVSGKRHRLWANDGLINIDGVDNSNNLRTSLRISATQAKFQDTRTGTTAVGLEYSSNYSANFTNRSLVDKGYVLSALTGGTANAMVFSNETGAVKTIETNIDVLGQGQIILTSGSSVISGISTNFTDATTGLGVGYWFSLWVYDSSNNLYRIGLGSITNNTLATMSTHYNISDLRKGYSSNRGATFVGVSGTYNYYIVRNIGEDLYSFVGGNGALARNFSFSFGGGSAATGQTSVAFGRFTEAGGNRSFVMGELTKAGGIAAFAGGFASATSIRVLANGNRSFNFSENNASQTAGHGALAPNSVILGGLNHNIPSNANRSVIIGGNLIKAVSAVTDTVYLPKVRIGQGTGGALTSGSTSNDLLVRNVGGVVETRTISSIISAGKSLATITGDSLTTSFNVVHNKNTRDVIVQVYENASPYGTILVDVERNSVNDVNIVFNTAPTTGSQYRVIII